LELSRIYSKMCVCHSLLKRYSEALKDAEACIEADFKRIRGYFCKISVLIYQDRYEECARFITVFLPKFPMATMKKKDNEKLCANMKRIRYYTYDFAVTYVLKLHGEVVRYEDVFIIDGRGRGDYSSLKFFMASVLHEYLKSVGDVDAIKARCFPKERKLKGARKCSLVFLEGVYKEMLSSFGSYKATSTHWLQWM